MGKRGIKHSRFGRAPARLGVQRGVVVIMAIIALVGMTLAALALVRSVDTANLVAGNIALKQGALLEAEAAMNEAFACMDRGGALMMPGKSLGEDHPECNYYAALNPDNAKEPYGVPDILKDASTGTTNAATGNTRMFMIERMCVKKGDWNSKDCMESPFGKAARETDRGEGGLTPPQALYRISVKISGTRGVTSYSQMILNATP